MTHTTPEVLVIVGTDHHDFGRLVGAMDEWADETGTDVLVQYGMAAAPTRARGVQILARKELDALLAQTSLVVSHGGPATIADIRAFGHKPIVMPREGSRHEAVDDHQLDFSRRLAASGMIRLATTVEDLRVALDDASRHPEHFRHDPSTDLETIEESVARFAVIADEVTRASLRRRRRQWFGRRP